MIEDGQDQDSDLAANASHLVPVRGIGRTADRQSIESESRYRRLFESLDQGFFVIEVLFGDDDKPFDYRFLEVNPAFERNTGLNDVVGKTMLSLAPGHDAGWFDIYGRIARAQQAERFEASAEHQRAAFHDVYAFPFGPGRPNQVGILFHDITKRKEADAERELLTHELSHRVKNTLAVVQGLANQTSRETHSVEEFRLAFIGRLEALGQAHGLLLESQWQSADLRKLVEKSLHAYDIGKRHDIIITGDPVLLKPKQGLGLALILHELATNAAKYGALSSARGGLRVSWTRESDAGQHLRIHWQERNGPPVLPPQKRGFGTKLIDRASQFELRGEANLHFDPDGLKAEIAFPLVWESPD